MADFCKLLEAVQYYREGRGWRRVNRHAASFAEAQARYSVDAADLLQLLIQLEEVTQYEIDEEREWGQWRDRMEKKNQRHVPGFEDFDFDQWKEEEERAGRWIVAATSGTSADTGSGS